MRNLDEIRNCKRIIWEMLNDNGGMGVIQTHNFMGTVIMSNDAGWEHVSVSPKRKSQLPSWDDMCFVKDIFWNDEETVVQYHPPKSEYIDNLPNCLHLWKCTYKDMVRPPMILVGTKGEMSKSEFDRQLKEAYAIAGEPFPSDSHWMGCKL